ncbi:hypothetical protein AGMMS49992_24670 [Clostridia bacterium]|nr:hypothetical protein AGMMS49992_24670 [Clostridia bacterium]
MENSANTSIINNRVRDRLLTWVALNPVIAGIIAAAQPLWFPLFLVWYNTITSGTIAANIGTIVTIIFYALFGAHTALVSHYNTISKRRMKVVDLYRSVYRSSINFTNYIKDDKRIILGNVSRGKELSNKTEDIIIETIISSLSDIRKNIASYAEINYKNVTAMILYKHLILDKQWNLLDDDASKIVQTGDEYVNIPDSFSHFMFFECDEHFYMLNDKNKEGIEDRDHPIYHMNPRDQSSFSKARKYGSIIGYRFLQRVGNDKLLDAALYISTYGKQIDTSKGGKLRQEIENEIREIILPLHINKLSYYLDELYLLKLGGLNYEFYPNRVITDNPA